jgi:hypothetical protein
MTEMSSTAHPNSTGAALLDLYPQLSALAKVPPFVAAAADDYWLESVAQWLGIPDLIEGEETHWGKLIHAIPELAKFGDVPLQVDPEAMLYRQRARFAAVRTIAAACGLGQLTFTAHPLLGGDASLKITLASGRPCRVGQIRHASWKPSPTTVTQVQQLLSGGDDIAAVEKVFFPLLAAGAEYERHFQTWTALKPLRAWNQNHRLPLIALRASADAVPGCYVERFNAQNLAEIKVPIAVAAKIASPYAAPVVRETREKLAPELPPTEELILWAMNRCGA